MKYVTVYLNDRSNAEGLMSEGDLARLLEEWKAWSDVSKPEPESPFWSIGYEKTPSVFEVVANREPDFLHCHFHMCNVRHVRVSPVPERLRGYAALAQ